MQYSFDCSDFKKYLFRNKKFRVEGLSIWVNSIPIPIDIFNDLFDRSHELFSLYLDHIIGALIINSSVTEDNPIQLKLLPDKKLVEEHNLVVGELIEKELSINSFKYRSFADKASDYLGIDNYSMNPESIMKALAHKGKKYSRIYCPQDLKNLIKSHDVTLLENFASGNFDMFGNVIADEMGIYRIGFSDALAQIFSRLLDFKINECASFSLSNYELREKVDEAPYESYLGEKIIISKTVDGTLWEPLFDGEVKVKINPKHPYFANIPKLDDKTKCYYELLLNLASYEANLFSKSHLKQMENLRTDISRTLWLDSEK
ncbi:hypothetical protein [Vibrio mediterranei]|uniref:hypothetical protein n=1 Tax=Vibrio mediterranei TaxID=689 RepID=UPI001EFD1A2B|nr:hypothetical protein [Vibrio mediterranei]MCG9659447.1 hypothetical protein [Vibrio mediterranei]